DDVLTNDSTPALTGTVNDPTATVVVNVDGVDYPAVNNADELGTDGSFNAQVALGPDALDGTVVNVNGVNYTVTVSQGVVAS
ncbi:hypothetical protein ACSRDJ_19525, partial [Acinetobacter baumannii]|uniref:hypothetical protein n=1 Tax=Acinetobacter baumannii TaxID=470 RepID=UPI003ED9F404